MTQATNNLAAYIWSLADLLRGDFRQSQYGRIILPFTLLRRLEGVLESSRQAVLAEAERLRPLRLPEDAQERLLLRATNGFLSSGMEYVHESNPQATVVAFGQEFNPESYAICKADMLIKGQEVTNIKFGNTLSGDQLVGQKFDYMLSNSPFGVDWKKIEQEIKDEHSPRGFNGRFGPGLPRVSDGSLLFLLHLISKMRDVGEGGSRIGIILNGSPLFTGGAGSGESEISRFLLEADLLEAIVALPTDMFDNTASFITSVWVLTNKKARERRGKVQLINGVHLCGKMRKSLGSKRNFMDEADMARITRAFGDFAVIDREPLNKPIEAKNNRGRPATNGNGGATATARTFSSKVFATHGFGYRRLTIERPLRLSYQFSDERLVRRTSRPWPRYFCQRTPC